MKHSDGFSRGFLLILIAVAVLATTSACNAPAPEEAPPTAEAVPTDAAPIEEPSEQLMARGWKLVSITGANVEFVLTEDVEITLVFTPDGRVAGSGGCNRYFSAVELGEPGTLSLGPVGSTMMACPQQVMAQEQQFLMALQEARQYRLAGNRLELNFGDDGVLTFEATESPES